MAPTAGPSSLGTLAPQAAAPAVPPAPAANDETKKKLDPEATGKAANELFKAMDGLGTDEKAIWKTLQGKSAEEITAIRAEYKKAKGRDLDSDLKGELSGSDLKRAEALMTGDKHTAALEALKDAKAQFGTTEPEKVKEALAALPDPSQMKDPGEKEKAIEERRALLKEAGIDSGTEEAKGVAATAAKYALIGSVIPGVGTLLGGIVGGVVGALEGDKDARQNNKMLEAVVAGDEDKLAGEVVSKELHGGVFGHGGILGLGIGRDEAKIEASLEGAKDPRAVAAAYEEATGKELGNDLEERLSGDDKDVTSALLRTHDKDPRKAAEASAEVAAARIHRAKDGLGTDEDGIYKQLDGKSDAERKAIVAAYDARFKDKEGLDFGSMLKDELSGNDLTKATQLADKGKLDPELALKVAMDGAGTDTRLIVETLKGKSKAEVDSIVARYDAANAPRTFKEDMGGELKISGRDGFDIKQALEGDPETIEDPTERAKAKLARASAAYDFERGSGAGVLTKCVDVFSDSGRIMDEHHAELEKLNQKMKDGTPLSRDEQGQLGELTRYAKDDQEDFRAARDSASNAAAGATTAVVAATVAVLIEVGTAGAATPALIAAMSALAGGAASMGVKAAVQGASYGNDQIATDAVMTLVQAATAGVGQTGKFLELVGKVPGLKELAGSKVGLEMIKQAFMNSAGQGAGALVNQDTYRGEGNGALKVLGAFGSGAVSGAATGAILGGTNARFGSGYLAGALGGATAGVVQTALEVGANPDEEWGGKLAMNVFNNASGGIISAAGHQAREQQMARAKAAAEGGVRLDSELTGAPAEGASEAVPTRGGGSEAVPTRAGGSEAPSIEVVENTPGPYHEPPEELMQLPFLKKPPGVTGEAVMNHNQALEQMAQDPVGRETLRRMQEAGVGKPKLAAELPKANGTFDPDANKVELNTVRDGKATPPEAQRSVLEHEVDHAKLFHDDPHAADPRTAATPAEAAERLVAAEARARVRQLQAADAQVERILTDGELRPAENGVDAHGRPTSTGELESVIDQRKKVVGAEAWDQAHSDENVKRLREEIGARPENAGLSADELAARARAAADAEGERAVGEEVRRRTGTEGKAKEMWAKANAATEEPATRGAGEPTSLDSEDGTRGGALSRLKEWLTGGKRVAAPTDPFAAAMQAEDPVAALPEALRGQLDPVRAALGKGDVHAAMAFMDRLRGQIPNDALRARLEAMFAAELGTTDPAAYRDPHAMLNGQPLPPSGVAGELWHGTNLFNPADVFANGLPVGGPGLDLLEHVNPTPGGKRSAFRGATAMPLMPGGEAGAALWPLQNSDHGWAYVMDGVPYWDANSLLEGRKKMFVGYGSNLMRGELEMSILSGVDPRRIRGAIEVSENRWGRPELGSEAPNPNYVPLER